MINKSYALGASGSIQSGTITYSYDPTSGVLSWSVVVNMLLAGIIPLTKNWSGVFNIPARLLDSGALIAGEKFTLPFGVVTLTSIDEPNHEGHVAISINASGVVEAGTAVLDLSGPYATLKSASSNGQIMGVDQALILTEVA